MLDFRFWGAPNKRITKETIADYLEVAPKRIHFATTHKNALRAVYDKSDVLAWFSLPFRDSIGPILDSVAGISLLDKKSGSGVCFPAKDDAQLESIRSFMTKFNELVFLRDNLDLSVALSMNMKDDKSYTEIGECENQVKYHSQSHDTSKELKKLAFELKTCLENLPYYDHADFICAVPSSKPFMNDIISSIDGWSDRNISAHVSWKNKIADIKNEDDFAIKFEALERSGLEITGVDLKGKAVVLVDDMYKSGATMQFVAMKLKEFGARHVFGICLVKSLGNN